MNKPHRSWPRPSANHLFAAVLVALSAAIYVLSGPPPGKVNGKTELTFWSGWAGEELRVVQRHVDEFNRTHPDIHVKMTSITNSYQKMKVAFAGEDTPDICATIWSHELADYALRDTLEPLDGYLARSQRRREDYYPAVWDTYQFEGRTYALSQAMTSFFIGYNKKLFRAAGLDPERPPQTLAEFDQYTERLTRYRNNDPRGELLCLGFQYPYGDPHGDFLSWCVAFGVNFWDPAQQKLLIDDKEMVQCLKWLKQNVNKYGATRVRAFQSTFGNMTSINNPFIAGRVAMIQMGDWYRSIIEQYAPKDFEWGWFPMPAPPGGRSNSTFLSCSMFVIPKASRHKEEAWEFIEYMTSGQVSKETHVGNSPSALPALRAVAADPEFQAPYWQFVRSILASPNAMAPPKFPLFDRFSNELSRLMDFVVSGALSPEAGVHQLSVSFQAEVDQALAPARPGRMAKTSPVLPNRAEARRPTQQTEYKHAAIKKES